MLSQIPRRSGASKALAGPSAEADTAGHVRGLRGASPRCMAASRWSSETERRAPVRRPVAQRDEQLPRRGRHGGRVESGRDRQACWQRRGVKQVEGAGPDERRRGPGRRAPAAQRSSRPVHARSAAPSRSRTRRPRSRPPGCHARGGRATAAARRAARAVPWLIWPSSGPERRGGGCRTRARTSRRLVPLCATRCDGPPLRGAARPTAPVPLTVPALRDPRRQVADVAAAAKSAVADPHGPLGALQRALAQPLDRSDARAAPAPAPGDAGVPTLDAPGRDSRAGRRPAHARRAIALDPAPRIGGAAA